MQRLKTSSSYSPTNRLGRSWTFLAGWLTFITIGTVSSAFGQALPSRCHAQEYNAYVRSRNPQLQQSQERLNKLLLINRDMNRGSARITSEEETIIIPVVVHVIHNNKSNYIGGANNSNISDEQIFSQIDVLNEDYRRKEGTNGFNTNPVGADMNIEFRLATVDPEGKPTNGITRTYIPKESFAMHEDSIIKSQAYWPSNRYLNIWVTSLSNNYLGYAQFPDAGNVPGLRDYEGAAETDGVVINHKNFGRIGTAATGAYNMGRSTTHEVGHWLGLVHTWGDVDCGDDYCDDTPPTFGPNRSTSSCPDITSNCNGQITYNMIENFMDYSADRCMNVFTNCQKERVRTVLLVSPRRRQLVESARELPESNQLLIKVYKNPIRNGILKADILFKDTQNLRVELFDAIGRSVMATEYTNTGSQSVELDVHTLRQGIYLLHASTPQERQVKRVLVLNNE